MHYISSTSSPGEVEDYYTSGGGVGEEMQSSDSLSYIFIAILIITLSFMALSFLIVMFIRQRAFFISRSKGKMLKEYQFVSMFTFKFSLDDNIGMRPIGYNGRTPTSDNSRFVVNITGGNNSVRYAITESIL